MKRPLIPVIIIAFVFTVICTAYGLFAPQIWNSPDETAVAFFSKTIAGTGNIWHYEPTNLFGKEMVHPRSIISVNANLVPGSFYGIMYYFSALVKVLGVFALAFGTPIATAIASVIIFFFLRRLYEAKHGVIGQILFLANPGVWYFSTRGLYPNMLFIDMVIIGLGVLYLRPWKSLAGDRGNEFLGRTIDDLIGLLCLGLALFIRPVEFIWLLPILVVTLWYNRKKLTIIRGILGVIFFGFFAVLLLMLNNDLYGSPLNFGYTAGSTMPGVAIPALSSTSRLPEAISAPRPFILPFGFHPRAGLTNLWNYLLLFTWWVPLLAILGLLTMREKKHRQYLSRVFVWVTFVLGVYYGSGIFIDSSITQWTIGSSYIRYFLPASILLIPFATHGIMALSAWKKWIGIVVMCLYVLLSAWTIYFRSAESLSPMRSTLDSYQVIKTEVLKEVGVDDIIITERSDKIFFPDRRIMIGLREKSVLDELPRLMGRVKIYYYGITIDEKELPTINKELQDRKLQLGRIKSFGNETLYQITFIEK